MGKETVFNFDELKKDFVNKILKSFLILSIPAMAFSLSRMFFVGFHHIYVWSIALYAVPVFLFLFRERINYKISIIIIYSVLIVSGFISFLMFSFFSMTLLYFFMSIILAILFLNKKVAWSLLILFVSLFILVFLLYKNGFHSFIVDFNQYNNLTISWATQISFFVLFSIMIIFLMFEFHSILYKHRDIKKTI